MAAPIKPALKRAQGNDSWLWVPAIADQTAPTLAEVNAAAGFNLSCSLFSDQEGVSASTDKVTLPQLLCETETYQVNGATSYTAPDFTVSFDPQAASGADGKKAWEAMDDNASGFLVQRKGVTATDDLAAGQFVNVYPAQLGVKVPTKTGTGAEAVYAFTVGVSVTGQPSPNVAIAA